MDWTPLTHPGVPGVSAFSTIAAGGSVGGQCTWGAVSWKGQLGVWLLWVNSLAVAGHPNGRCLLWALRATRIDVTERGGRGAEGLLGAKPGSVQWMGGGGECLWEICWSSARHVWIGAPCTRAAPVRPRAPGWDNVPVDAIPRCGIRLESQEMGKRESGGRKAVIIGLSALRRRGLWRGVAGGVAPGGGSRFPG